MTERFKNLLHTKWLEKIVQKVEGIVEQEFGPNKFHHYKTKASNNLIKSVR